MSKSKFSPASEEVSKIVDEIANELGLMNWGIDFQPLYVERAKTPCSVVRANKLAEYASNRDDLVFVLCNKEVFEGTDKAGHPLCNEQQMYMWIRNEMEKIVYDTERDSFSLNGPSITIPLSFLENMDKMLVVNSSILGLQVMAQLEEIRKERAAEEKARKKENRRKKNF